jgi:bifunctional UDP-N-acetylglucosamine pyrophosphorylase/glucosamine-1-phosphate N-acetyltransferase
MALSIGGLVWNLQEFGGKGRLMTQTAAIILAAGKGTRMKSDTHKVLHPIAGQPMLMHLLANVDALNPAHKVVVVGSGKDQLEKALAGSAALAVQEPQLGTGHAVQQAETALAGFEGDVLILYGDVPFVPTATMQAMIDRLNAPDAPAVVVLAFEPEDSLKYGRVITDGDRVIKMVEHKDATEDERAVRLCNSGLMAVKARDLFALLARVDDNNAVKEFYLVDIVNIANADGRHCAVVVTDPFDVAGINSREELAVMEAQWQVRRRRAAMEAGITLIAPETVWFAHDTVLGRDVLIEPNVVFGPGVSVGDHAVIHAFSHIEGASVGAHCSVGPFARLRPGAVMEEGAKIGNFVEMKKARLGAGAKASHLTYLGDADVGAGANIGAGTITCNYDGYFKYRTEIGEGAFIGSNSALVAPVSIGAGAIVAAGSVVTADVQPDALAIARGNQENKPHWAARFRDVMLARKKGGK